MIEWVNELRTDLGQEFGNTPRVVTLATVDLTGWPHARTVVCRRLDDDGTIYVASDARSQKNVQTRLRGSSEFCFWLPTLRKQYRLQADIVAVGASVPDGALDVENETERVRREVWESMSFSARALFFWPSPGDERTLSDADFPKAVDVKSPPDAFEVLLAAPRMVESLDLRTHPHTRVRWNVEDQWGGRELNP